MITGAKEKLDSKKLRGGYYTPLPITEFISRWAITHKSNKVLEPSCGDGNFIESAIKRFLELGVPNAKLFGLLKGIELLSDEAEKSKRRSAAYGLNSTTIVNSDFFDYISETNDGVLYDAVIGNPPFIRYQNFPEIHREKAFRMMEAMGLKPNKLTNIWVPFLVISANLLNKKGKLAMVIPAELFQVKYAAETRVFLSNFFSRITIITFKKLVFDDIQQEIVLLLCEKEVDEDKGIRVLELDTLSDLNELNLQDVKDIPVKKLEHNSEKWTQYFLDDKEIRLIRKIRSDKRIQVFGSFMDVDVGIVTGRNEFFMINQETVDKWKLGPYTRRVVSRSNHLKGIRFDDADFTVNLDAQLAGFLFLPPDKDFNDLPKACQAYIKYGEEMGFHTGYKCKIRKRWYVTPSLGVPDAFVLRQVGEYPKVIVNTSGASSTDTIHRAKRLSKVKPETVALSFLNSLSFAFSEILGRSYGGGVLTFEPSEIEEIPLPILNGSKVNYEKIDNLIREKKIEQALDIIDEHLLIKQFNFTKRDVLLLRGIWRKLSNRRMNRN